MTYSTLVKTPCGGLENTHAESYNDFSIYLKKIDMEKVCKLSIATIA